MIEIDFGRFNIHFTLSVYMRITNVRLRDDMVEKLDRIASSMLISRSELIRNAVGLYIKLIENLGTQLRTSTILLNEIRCRKIRGSIVLDLGNNTAITISSFSYGGAGEKPGDSIRAEYRTVGEIIARQALTEMLSRNIAPHTLIANFTCDIESGMKMLQGIAGIFKGWVDGDRIFVTGSEESLETIQTGISLSAVGVASVEDLESRAKSGERLWLIGEPILGEDLLKKSFPLSLKTIKRLSDMRKMGEVGDIITVRSDGVRRAIEYLADFSGNRVIYLTDDFPDTGCPSTALIASSKLDLQSLFNDENVQLIGELV